MSARAAWRFETLGLSKVYRYTAGKEDWAAYGLPIEGTLARDPTAGDAARHDVPMCRLSDSIGAVHRRVQAAGWDVCVVVHEERVVLGMLAGKDWDAQPDPRVEEVMEEGPATYRPDVPLHELVERMQKKDAPHVLVTNSDGHLIGIVYRTDAVQRVAEYQPTPAPNASTE